MYAVEIDERRYTTLCEQIRITSSSCVKTLNEDSLTLEGEDYSDVDCILVDPTCSSSGIIFYLQIDIVRIQSVIIHKSFP